MEGLDKETGERRLADEKSEFVVGGVIYKKPILGGIPIKQEESGILGGRQDPTKEAGKSFELNKNLEAFPLKNSMKSFLLKEPGAAPNINKQEIPESPLPGVGLLNTKIGQAPTAPETPAPAPKTKTTEAGIAGPYKPTMVDPVESAKRYKELDTAFNTRIDGIKQLAAEAEGYEKEKYEKLGKSLDLVRDKIDAFDSNERKMLAWERVGDMLARSLGQLGAGLAGVSKPLELQAGDQTARYADLQAIGRQQREALGQERSIGEKSYSERMRDIGKQAAEMRNEEERKYSVGTQALGRQEATEQRGYDSINDFMARTQAFKEREADRTALKTDRQTEATKKSILGQMSAQYADIDKQLANVSREAALAEKLGSALSNPKTAKQEIKNLKAQYPDADSWFGGSTLDNDAAIQMALGNITKRKTEAEATRSQLQGRKDSLIQKGEQIAVMGPEELNAYAAEVKKKGKPAESTNTQIGSGETLMLNKSSQQVKVPNDKVQAAVDHGWTVVK